MALVLIADSGSTKSEWYVQGDGIQRQISARGISPYFLSEEDIIRQLRADLIPHLPEAEIARIHYYGTGCADPANAGLVRSSIQAVFPGATVEVQTDLMGAARGACGTEPGVACILGTGSNSCYYDGLQISRNSPGLGYVLGDEGSGAYLGIKVLRYYLYGTFDEELRARFDAKYVTNNKEILDHVYRKPLPNRYLAGFALFLAENRGHYMIENIIEDGLNDFFFTHLSKYPEIWSSPVHFTGSIAFGFSDVVRELCGSYGFELGNISQSPLQGLTAYHQNN